MDANERHEFEQQLLSQALNPLAFAFQNAIVAVEPAERFAHLSYLHEVVLKCLAAQGFGRVVTLELISSELITYFRNEFRQPSTGHWSQLLAHTQKILIETKDRPAQFLDGLMRKKLHDESVLKLDRTITELSGHSQRDKTRVTLAELLQALVELRNKTRGHGAPRRAFFEDINPLLEASLLIIIKTLQPYLWGSMVYLEKVTPQDENVRLQGQVLTGVTRLPWQATFAPVSWLQPHQLFLLETKDNSQTLYPLDPLLVWDRRDEVVGFFNGYIESKQQMEYLSYARGGPWHDRSRSYEQAFRLPPIVTDTSRSDSMKSIKLWSNKGVALYPIDFPLVGQNSVFNGLLKFKQAFLSSHNDIAGFFALIGDWGLGKTRIGYELFAQTFGHIERWVLNQEDFVAPDGADGRLIQPQLAEGILPLYIRYGIICDDDLFAENWVARVATTALELVVQTRVSYDVPPDLLKDLQAVLKSRGVDLSILANALTQSDDDDARLKAAMEVLRPAGIEWLWVVVDEVETLADLKKGLRDEGQEAIKEDYLDMVSTVIKHENYRQAHPYVSFLVLCSTGMRDKIQIGPNRRRTDSIELEPNRIGDVHAYVKTLQQKAEAIGQTVDYPPGILEGAFIACNRNFGWFNFMMSSIHESYRRAKAQGRAVTAWQLIEEFAQTETRAQWIFDLSALGVLPKVRAVPEEFVKQLTFGQLPVSLLQTNLDSAQAESLKQATIPGMSGTAFVELVEVHVDANTLATELVKPELGFKLAPYRGGDWYLYYDNEISIGSLLAALRAFSVDVPDGNFVICRELTAFTAQLSALYERPNVNISQIAEPLHGVFLKYQVTNRYYIGPSFVLLQQMNKLLKREAGTVAFLQDTHKEAALDQYTDEIEKSERKRRLAICQGFARLLDDTIVEDVEQTRQVQSAAGVTFNSEFQSPRFEGLQVTAKGQVTVVYSHDLEKLAQELGDLVGQTGVHPIIVLLPSGVTIEDWQAIRLPARVQLCTMTRALTRVEETFLIKFSGRGKVFQPHDILSARTQSIRGTLVQNLQKDTMTWRDEVEGNGYLLRPIWYSKNIDESSFGKGFRAMLVNNQNIDQLAPDVSSEFDTTIHDRIRKACQYNAEPSPGQAPLLPIISSEPHAPTIPPAFGAILYELESQATLDVLARRFFFAIPDKMVKVTRQLEQILTLLQALGMVTHHKSTYRAVDSQTLKDYRQATSAWLNGECQNLLDNLGDILASDAITKLKKQSTSFAPKDLEAVEQEAKQADFSVLKQGGSTPPEAIHKLAQQIDKIERLLNKICPPSIYQQTGEINLNFTTDHLAAYEQRLNTFSLWETIHFYHWLREQFNQRRQQLGHAINQQLAEAERLNTIDGHPFPTAPLTMPLKTILNEVNATLGAGGLSSRGFIEVPGYPQSVNTFLFMEQFGNAWQRLETLRQYVERAQPTSFWARFQAVRSQWVERLKDYDHAATAWDTLAKFVGEANSPAWVGAKALKANLDQFKALAEGSLRDVVNAEISQGEEKLIEVLEEEVQATAKFQSLPAQISELRQAVEAELKAIIDQDRIQALSKILAVKRRSQLTVPPLAKTYSETKTAYEVFNIQVVEIGRRYFEDASKETAWDKWVEIFIALRDGQYVISDEDEIALRELEEMKLIERTVKLK
jgi:hypothetical protein